MANSGSIWPAAPLPSRPAAGVKVKDHPTWHVNPEFPLRSRVPFTKIMGIVQGGLDAGHPDGQIAQALQRAIGGDERLSELIDHQAPVSGGPLAQRKLVFEDFTDWRLYVYQQGKHQPEGVWRIPGHRISASSWRSVFGNVDSWRQPARCIAPCKPRETGGALIRREHASVEVVSPAGTRVIIDPIFRSPLLACAAQMPVPQPGIAAAFVTHSHSDHSDIATLDWLAASGTAIHLPTVPRTSLLAEDMAGQLGLCGVPATVHETGTLTQIDDVIVEALPFFGEQPSARVCPAEPGIRNWGNCYRVDTPGFSALVLADSGADPAGDMLAAIQDSVRRRGPIDVVLGCLRTMYMPFDMAGLSSYYVVLPMSGLRGDHALWRSGKLPSATLGPARHGRGVRCRPGQRLSALRPRPDRLWETAGCQSIRPGPLRRRAIRLPRYGRRADQDRLRDTGDGLEPRRCLDTT